jgi:putative ABC transport system permease protein
MLLFYIKSSLRSIGRKKMFSALNISGLAIGLCVFLLALEYFSFETGFNRFHANLRNLYRVNINAQTGKSASTFPTFAPMMQGGIPGVRKAVRFADNFNYGAVLSYIQPQNPSSIKSFRQDDCVFVDAAFLDAFSFSFVAGGNQLAKTNTAVITSPVAKKFFGSDAAAVGKVLQLHNQFGQLPVTVTGVLADLPAQSDIQFGCLLSIEILNNPGYTTGSDWAKLNNWGNDSYTTFVWLDNKASGQVVANKASALWRQTDPDYKKEKGRISLQPLGDIHLGNNLRDDSPTYGSLARTYFIMALGILVLCIAWINYVNFSTAWAISQAKQIGIHKIVGSAKRQIVARYIFEATMLNLFGLMLAVCLSGTAQSLFNYLTWRPLSLQYINNVSTWLYSGAIILCGVLLCGGYVGAVLARFKPIAMMRFNNIGNTGNALLRKGLVIFQFVTSSVFITATIIAYMQIDFMRHHDLGMNIDNLVVISGPSIKDSTYKTNKAIFKNELARLPFVEKITTTGSVPGIGGGHNFGADGITGANAQKGDEHNNYSVSEVDEHYFSTFQIAIVSGVEFTNEDANQSFKGNKLMVNETAARLLGYQPATAVGHVVNWDKKYIITGVVKDYHHSSLKEKIEPIIYVPQHNNACYTVKVNLDNLAAKMERVRTLYQQLYPGNPFAYTVLKDAYNAQYNDEQRAGIVALSISALVVIIACLGLAGLAVFTAKRRNKEMGIRKVLGAQVLSLFALLSREFLWLVAIAFIIAVPVAWYGMHKWLEAFAYRIAIPWWAFAATGACTLFIALATVSLQAIKTALVNPAVSLRSE